MVTLFQCSDSLQTLSSISQQWLGQILPKLCRCINIKFSQKSPITWHPTHYKHSKIFFVFWVFLIWNSWYQRVLSRPLRQIMSEKCTSSALNVKPPPQKRRRTNVKWEVIQTFPEVDAYNKWMEMKAPTEQVVICPLQSTAEGGKRIFKCTYRKKCWYPYIYKLLTFFSRVSTEAKVSWNG